jgi:hypothetical protein
LPAAKSASTISSIKFKLCSSDMYQFLHCKVTLK